METKPGWKTSEFWLTLVAIVVGGLLASGLITSAPIMQALGALSSILGALGYTTQRGFVKVADSKAAAFVAASQGAQAVNPSLPST